MNIERQTRRTTGELLRTERVISKMIDRVKALFDDVVVPDADRQVPSVEWEADEE